MQTVHDTRQTLRGQGRRENGGARMSRSPMARSTAVQ